MSERFRATTYRDDGSRAEFPEGIAKRYELERDDSARFILHEVIRSNGSTLEEEIDEEFVVDLFDPQRIPVPEFLRNRYRITQEGRVLDITLKEILREGKSISVSPETSSVTANDSASKKEPMEQLKQSMPSLQPDVDLSEKYEGREPAREILESITADVFTSLGYDAETNATMENREGGMTEVDVWAKKPEANFIAYVSCKNWDRNVGRQVIDEEVGRVRNLRQLPQLKVLVVKGFNGKARESAKVNGFLTVELGEQANEDNAKDIYQLVHERLSQVSIALAPPRIEELTLKAQELSEELADLAQEINQLSTTVVEPENTG